LVAVASIMPMIYGIGSTENDCEILRRDLCPGKCDSKDGGRWG